MTYELDELCMRICVTVDSHGLDLSTETCTGSHKVLALKMTESRGDRLRLVTMTYPHLTRRPDDATCDLAAVRDDDLVEHQGEINLMSTLGTAGSDVGVAKASASYTIC